MGKSHHLKKTHTVGGALGGLGGCAATPGPCSPSSTPALEKKPVLAFQKESRFGLSKRSPVWPFKEKPLLVGD